MTTTWRHLPPAARAIANAAVAAVEAARSKDAEAYDEAVEKLAALDSEQTGRVLGAVVRTLLEERHPDGLDGDDIRAALEHAVRAAATWRDVDPQVMVVLLVGALGIHETDEEAPLPPRALAGHAPLLIDDLLAERSFAALLTRAFAEIERAEIND
ncbi:hypothetical protein [Dactylosporangium matsuzakiense]|uniref:Uncharacterized protein n=1 Tax=Dactylosporangium matsuzakiense TaxID=53360 RepID=A0A9W6NLD4_9ACTN|nr:hypothetical protein [Dactylosporangium matsuzakiense]UWZ46621.1 hypothetical protein Dmats_09460 [Dactylosporangium matsuzakiense]GLL01244.1 hypothetical protein GCM10017581_029850 [Dactylosporangium matsuzakiense]